MLIKNISIKKDCAVIDYDDNKKLLIDPSLIQKLDLSIDKDIRASVLLKANEEFSYEYAMNAAIKYLSYSMRSKAQVEKHLQAKYIQRSCIQRVVDKLTDYKYIDDMAYSKIYTADAINSKKGKEYIKNKLKLKGVDNNTINEALLSYDDNELYNNAFILLSRKNTSLARFPQTVRREKLMRSAISQSFYG